LQIPNFLRNHGQHAQTSASPPPTLPNGASGSHNNINSVTSGGAQLQQQQQQHMTGDASWLHQSRPPSRGLSQITRPVEQLLSSPADAWGLQGLLHEIKTGTGDKAMFILGEDLNRMGINLEQTE